MAASHKTNQPHMKVGKDEEKKKMHVIKHILLEYNKVKQNNTARLA